MLDQETLTRHRAVCDAIDREKSAIAWYVAACFADDRTITAEDIDLLRLAAAELERLHAESVAVLDEPVPYVPTGSTS